MTQKEIEMIEKICRNDTRYEKYLERMGRFYEDYHVPHPAVVWFEASMLVMVLKQIAFGQQYAFTAWGNGKSDGEAYAVKWTTLYLLRNGDDRFCKLDDSVINSLTIDVDNYWFHGKLRKKRTPKGHYFELVECLDDIEFMENKVAEICLVGRHKPVELQVMKVAVRAVVNACLNDPQCISTTLNLITYYNTVSNGLFNKELITLSERYNNLLKQDFDSEDSLDLVCKFDDEQVRRSGIMKMPKIVLSVMEYMLKGKYRLEDCEGVRCDDMAVAFYAVLTYNDKFWKGTKQQYADMMKDLFDVDVKVKTMSRWIERNGTDYLRWGGRTHASSKRSRLAEDFEKLIKKVSMYKVKK